MRLLFLKITLCAALCIFGSIYIGCAVEDTQNPDEELYSQVELFSNAVAIVQSDYVDEVEPKKLVYGALKGMLSSLDGYSQFMDSEDFEEMMVETKGEFGGLGIEIGIRDEVLTVIAPLDGTPAEKAGLKAGDKIVKIGDDVTRDMTLADAVKRLRGKPGTKAEITILRESEDALMDFTIVRSIIKLESIKTAEIMDGDIGYIKLVEFQQKTPRELEEKLASLKKRKMKALILDLRNNPGGLLEVACEVAEKFLPEESVVVSLKSRMPDQNKVYKSRAKRKKFLDFPMVVMVNEGAASASEIVAGAIQDNRRGIILGEKTFGKGSVQTVIPLKGGVALKLSTASYYTPSGRSIRKKGIMPDLTVKLLEQQEPEKKKEDMFEKVEEPKEQKDISRDNQLQAALDVLRAILIYNYQN